MPRDEPSEVLAFLAERLRAPGAEAPETIQTHISILLLGRDRVYKLKRAIRLPYLDFSTPGLRLDACRQEVALNRRTAPALYLGARRITREADGALAFDGQGELVDAVVEMRRFAEDTLFTRLAQDGRLDRPLLTALARNISAFHARAERAAGHDGARRILDVLELNEQCPDMAPAFGAKAVDALRAALRESWARHAPLLDDRARAGKVRRCHGDLHLRNLCLIDGQPTLFDCIEFNESIATIDVLYDLAFLLMDLWRAGLRAEANWVMNRYMDESGDTGGLPLLPFFMALRASIRAQVLSTQAAMPGAARQDIVPQARAYLDLSMALLRPVPALLLAIGGLSGSGKSTVAAAIAHRVGAAPGARIAASDRIRKRIAGVPAETPLPSGSYTRESSDRVYAALEAEAAHMLTLGHACIADAVFSRQDERRAIERCAAEAGAPFLGVWLEADPGTLVARVRERRNDPSDATADVVLAQVERHTRPQGWLTVQAGKDAAATEAAVLSAAGIAPGAGC
ncbi:AAA family ATPase [Castellaniella sp.]|uniref:bifunctional aminoglycoside phosphotransferase/ATP-binding protein n=1 Tax=Castellaniella sp. TaxID=1955812 RepID=UPI002AFE3CB5|nr:AAA family ATPase [Castellaniella sp.]